MAVARPSRQVYIIKVKDIPSTNASSQRRTETGYGEIASQDIGQNVRDRLEELDDSPYVACAKG